MKRRSFMSLLGGAALSPMLHPRGAHAQQHARVRRVGVLMNLASDDPEAQSRMRAFEKGLRDLGWVDGRNLRIEYRWGAADPNMFRSYAAELLGTATDLIVANSTPATTAISKALQEQGRTLPIVFTQVTDPIGQGLVANLAQPGGNLTGFTSFEFSIGTKWLELLKQVAPDVARVALLFNPDTAPFADLFWRPIESAAPSFAVTPIKAGARDAAALEAQVDGLAREPNGGLMVMPEISTATHRDLIIALAARHRLPAVYPFRYYAVSGGLVSYGSNVAEIFWRAAAYVDRILKGTRPGELPVQAPNKYELVVNLRTAKALGLEISPALLGRADEVFE
jgi:putative tryptophan/tyrosine transport system substrate-binding protein